MDFPRVDPVAVGHRRLARVALERAREVERVGEAGAVGDLADGQVGEAQQPGGLEHHAVGDELLRRAAGDLAERARERGGRDAERVGVVARVVVAGEVGLEQPREAALELDVGVAGLARLAARRVVPALDPQQQHGDQVALRARRRARRAGSAVSARERGDHAVERGDVAGGHGDRAPAAAGEQPARGGAPLGAAVDQLVAEAHDRAAQVAAGLEDVHLAAADHRQRARLDRHERRRRAGARPRPPGPRQLVVVVPVRLAHARAADLEPVERDHLDRALEPVQADARSSHARPRTAAANASTSSARVSCEHIQRTSPVCSSQV